MNFKDMVVDFEKEVDKIIACGRTPYSLQLQDSDLEALKKELRNMLDKIKKPST